MASKVDTSALFIRRLEDMLRISEASGRCICTNFLTPQQQIIAKNYLGKRCEYKFIPDYEESLSKCIVFNDDCKSNIVCLVCRISNKFVSITHRDIYGALMSLGLEKDKFGDVWVEEDRVVVYCKNDIANYVCQSITQIHKLSVKLTIDETLYVPVTNYVEKRVVVSSLRLDALVSELANISRSKSQELIKEGLVHLNYNNLVETSDICNNDDVISIRKIGRFKLKTVIGTTRKGSIAILVAKYI